MNKWSFTIIIVGIFLIFGYSFDRVNGKDEQKITKINIVEAHSLIERNKDNPDFFIIDFRTEKEYKSGHIPNSLNIDYLSENFKDEIQKLDRDAIYIVHCRSGGRSERATLVMKNLGFMHVYDMRGIVQWGNEGYKIVK